MTLIAAWREENMVPYLAGDLLITSPPHPEARHRKIPTTDRLDSLGLPRTVAGLRQKVCVVSDRLAVAWADSELCAGRVIRDLRREFASGGCSLEDIRAYLRTQDVGPPHCVLIGILLQEGEAEAFSWCSKTPNEFRCGFAQVAGSGQSAFVETFGVPAQAAGDIDTFGRALWRTALLLGNEVVVGSTLRESFGGGFQIAYALEGRFQAQPSVTYLFVAVREEGSRLHFGALDRILKFEFEDEILYALAGGEREQQKPAPYTMHRILPAYAGPGDTYATERKMSLRSDYYCISTVVRLRDRLAMNIVTIDRGVTEDLLRLTEADGVERLSLSSEYFEAIAELIRGIDRSGNYPTVRSR